MGLGKATGGGPHPFETDDASLLNTIKLPKNLNLLSDRLPQAKYELDTMSEMSTKRYKPVEVMGPPDGKPAVRKRSLMREKQQEKQHLKRNQSENLQTPKPVSSNDLLVGGEKLRDKNRDDYLETIREKNEKIGGGKAKSIPSH